MPRRERWTHPPLLGLEAPPAGRAVWRFRVAVGLLLLVLLALVLLAYRQLSGATGEDPGVSAAVRPAPAIPQPAAEAPAG